MKTSLYDRAIEAGAGSEGAGDLAGVGDGAVRERGLGARRVGSGDLREHVRQLRPKLDLLPTDERMMIELVATGDRSMHEYARMTGQNAGNLSRRYRSLWRRLHDPALDFVMGSRCPLPPEHRQIGVENMLLGMTICGIADKHRISKGQVQVVLAYIRGYVGSRGMIASVSGRKMGGAPSPFPAAVSRGRKAARA